MIECDRRGRVEKRKVVEEVEEKMKTATSDADRKETECNVLEVLVLPPQKRASNER